MKTQLLLVCLLFALLITSCENSSEPKFSDYEQMKSKHWQLISYKLESGEIVILEDMDDVLSKDFNLNFYQDSICYGTSGCNSYSANYLVYNDEISFSNLTSTEVYCKLTNEYMQSLGAATTWNYNNNILKIVSSSDILMTEMYFQEKVIEQIRYMEDAVFIDINTDGYNDFYIFQIDWFGERGDTTGKMILIHPEYDNRLSITPVELNKKIDNSISYYSLPHNLAVKYYNDGKYDDFWQGNFVSDLGLYLPIRYVFADDEYFGWIQISVDSQTGKVKIWDMALQNTPGKSINAGEKP